VESARVAPAEEGRVTVEVVNVDDGDQGVWIYAFWRRPPFDGPVGEIQGPFETRQAAEQAAQRRWNDQLDFDDVPEGWHPLRWADVPQELRDRIRSS